MWSNLALADPGLAAFGAGPVPDQCRLDPAPAPGGVVLRVSG